MGLGLGLGLGLGESCSMAPLEHLPRAACFLARHACVPAWQVSWCLSLHDANWLIDSMNIV